MNSLVITVGVGGVTVAVDKSQVGNSVEVKRLVPDVDVTVVWYKTVVSVL